MSTIRLYYGRHSEEMVNRLREHLTTDGDSVSSIEVRETVLDDGVIEALVDLIEARPVKVVQLDDCGAYMNKQAIRMARALGSVDSVRLSEPTFLSHNFLDCLLLSATKLKELKIQDRLDYRQIQALARGLIHNKTVKILDLSRSQFDSYGALAGGLKDNSSIEVLKMRSLGLNDGNIDVILDAVKGHPTLRSIDLSFNHCKNMEAMASVIKDRNCHLDELSLGHQNLWQSPKLEVTALARALRSNQTIKRLSLPRNKLRDSDLLVLTTAMACNTTLRTLDLRENLICDSGMEALALVLKKGSNLRELNVMMNPFGNVGSTAMLDAVQSNHGLLCVHISNDSKLNKKIRFAADLNKGGKRLLFQSPSLSIWPLVLARINKIQFSQSSSTTIDESFSKLDVMHYMLRGPALFEGVASSFDCPG